MRYALMATALAALLPSLTIITAAQNQPLKFEVSSVKLNKFSNGGYSVGCYASTPFNTIPKGMCEAVSTPLRVLLGEAYGVDFFRIADLVIGVPNGLVSDRFDVQGKAENASATSEELHAMLRNLLADRFKLQAHEEMREEPGYALVSAKNGAKLKEAAEAKQHNINAFGTAPTQLEGVNSSMADLAQYFSRVFHRPFSDETGLLGRYNFNMTFVFDAPQLPNLPVPLPPGARRTIPLNDSALPAISGALGQLGLKFDAKKIPVRFIIIDHAEKPDAN
jgi:uncharacterized protein (TIGR03435 family)